MINKYGDMYGAERIAELLGLDKSALDFNPTEDTVMKDASLLSWSENHSFAFTMKHKTNVNLQAHALCFSSRLSSVDTKYHVWKMGVVFTDNVSDLCMNSG